MIEDDVMLLDTFDTVYIWLGHGANETEKRESIRIAKVRGLSTDVAILLYKHKSLSMVTLLTLLHVY